VSHDFVPPAVGQGTWRMGESAATRGDEIDALRCGLDLGLTLIDTAEMYGDGGAETVVGQAIAGRRDEVLLVTKVMPDNASRRGTLRAAERSLKRLGTDHIDLYLLHWPGPHPLEQTFAAFEKLVEQGKILNYGVSNFDLKAMQGAASLPGGANIATNQILYNLTRRGIENRLLPWCHEQGVTVMAYSPFEQGMLPSSRALETIAERHACTPHQIALAWTLREPGTVAIPKAANLDHVRQNAAAASIRLDEQELAELDRAFPRPKVDRLETL